MRNLVKLLVAFNLVIVIYVITHSKEQVSETTTIVRGLQFVLFSAYSKYFGYLTKFSLKEIKS